MNGNWIGAFFAFLGALATAVFYYKQTIRVSSNSAKIRTVEVKAETETKHLDKAINSLQEQNTTQAQDMIQIRKEFSDVRGRLNTCLDDKAIMREALADMRIQNNVIKAQTDSVRRYHKMMQTAMREMGPDFSNQLTKYMLEHTELLDTDMGPDEEIK